MKILSLVVLLCFSVSSSAAGMTFKLLNGLSYYDILGIDQKAGDAELKRAYRAAMMKHHPDKGGPLATAQFVNEAYAVLKNASYRSAFDAWLRGVGAGPTPQSHREPPPPPPKTEEERRAETLEAIVDEIAEMSKEVLAKNPRTSKAEMADEARTVIIYFSRFLPGAQIRISDLDLLLNKTMAHSVGHGRGYSEMMSLAVGVITILRERARYPGFEDAREANSVLRQLESRLAYGIESHNDPRKRMHYDGIYEFLTGQSLLRRPPPPSPRPTISACEAALRYRTMGGMDDEADTASTIDIRL